MLARHSHNYQQEHFRAAKRVLKYLVTTKDRMLAVGSGPTTSNVRITVYSDSDWAGESDRKSVSGSLVEVNGHPITWFSKKQSIVALSSTEAELIALVEAVKRAKYVKQLVEDLGMTVELPMTIFGDNQAALLIAKRGVISRTKHIDIRKYYIKEEVDQGLIELKYTSTTDNLADILTKPLGRQVLERHTSTLFVNSAQGAGVKEGVKVGPSRDANPQKVGPSECDMAGPP